MPSIDISKDITPYYSDPMNDVLEIVHTDGDTYQNSTACGDKLIQLHKDLQRLDFPYFFVKIITTNTNIQSELETLHQQYSNEESPLKYSIVEGNFNKNVYKGDTMCVLPWIHKYVNPQGLVMPCCNGDEKYPYGSIVHNNLDDISTRPVQEQMIAGQRPSACNSCWQKEDSGLPSMRQRMNKQFSDSKNEKSFVLKYLDIRLSNKCNLMCRMCSGKFSNRIAQEELKLYGETKYKDEILSKDLVKKQLAYIKDNIDTVEQIYFAGGEPMIMKEHYEILNMLIESGRTDVEVSYNTNLSMLNFKQYNVLDYWKHFDRINLSASIDLIGYQSDYVRHGVEYDVLEKNYNSIKNLTNVRFNIASILHLMNIYNLPKLQRRWIELGVDCSDIRFDVLIMPEEQAINVLPEHYKDLALHQIQEHTEFLTTVENSELLINTWLEATEFMTSTSKTHLLEKFFRLTDDKDSIRKQKFEDYFPEYKDLRKYT